MQQWDENTCQEGGVGSFRIAYSSRLVFERQVERDLPSWSLLVREAEYRICAVGLGTKGANYFPLSCSFLYFENYFF